MISTEDKQRYKDYQKDLQREKYLVFTWQIIIFVLFFGLWEIASRQHWIDPLLFSSPSSIFDLIVSRIQQGTMLNHVWVTVIETLIGFLIGTVGGIVLATSLWFSNKISQITNPYLVVLNAMPKVALGPIIIVAFGPSYFAIIAMGAMVSIIITTLVVYSGFREVDENYETVLKSFGATRWQVFKEAVFPATFPTMISTFKVNVGLSWVGVIVGEFLVSKQGLGFLIIYGFQVFDFTLVMASLLLIAIFAVFMYIAVEKLERWLIRHRVNS